jgi:CRISPR-associated endonuclease/helicase Cas3
LTGVRLPSPNDRPEPPPPAALVAHTPNASGHWHLLADHLRGTAELARDFAAAIGPEASQLAYYAGLWHDIGKSGARFQQYLHDQAHGIGERGSGGDHKGAGAVHVLPTCDWLAFLIAGHHGGLPAGAELKGTLREWQLAPHVAEALGAAWRELGDLLSPPRPIALPGFAAGPATRSREFFLRLSFSCLVDADFLDTEAHFDATRTLSRVSQPRVSLAELWERCAADQEALIAASARSTVNDLREQIYRAAVEAASAEPGMFRLTVPTGGGKTRVGLAFGLRHALAHGLRRVIFAVPYTSITEQTAGTYREIFAPWPAAVLEHHSAVSGRDASDDAVATELWRRLACENWDAPAIVTTTVQFFESLLGDGPAACRKLHNVVGSVVVLDEAQTLPPRLLTPVLDALRELVGHYRVSVVFCTATQPAFQVVPGFAELEPREIAPDPPTLFRRLHRVTYDWPRADEQTTWQQVADQLRASDQGLAIVNTRRDALSLLDALGDPGALHLSTLLCGAHRRVVLAEVRARLQTNRPCRLVTTQVVEAGVDLDFPLVLRAFGPLDSIVQAAGRCNREGRRPEPGRVVVFDPAEGHLPQGVYRVAAGSARTVLAAGPPDVDDPSSFERFFKLFYGGIDTDARRVQVYRAALNYPETAQKSKLIVDDTVPVVVHYRGPRQTDRTADRLLARLRRTPERARSLVRRLQPYLVAVRRREIDGLVAQAQAAEVLPGLGIWEWLGTYDPIRGLGSSVTEPHEGEPV